MPAASAYIPNQRIFALFVGRSKSGKSVAGASFPTPWVDLDFDFRFDGIKAAIDQGLISAEGREYYQFPPRNGWKPVDEWLTQQESYRLQGHFLLNTIQVSSITSLTRLLVVTSHLNQGGKKIGNILRMSGPQDFNVESSGTHQVFDFLRSWPCNVIAEAHIVDKYGKLDKSSEFSETGITGEKLSIRDNLGENILTYFNNVFRFSHRIVNGKMRYFVEFSTDVAANTFGIPPGEHDITDKQFYPYLQALILKYKKPEIKSENTIVNNVVNASTSSIKFA